ncbi:MAG: hypothetical protein ABI970_05680 [Chloroflexota bacterium]
MSVVSSNQRTVILAAVAAAAAFQCQLGEDVGFNDAVVAVATSPFL